MSDEPKEPEIKEPEKKEIEHEVKDDSAAEMKKTMEAMQARIDTLESANKAREMRGAAGLQNPMRLMTAEEITDAILKGI